MSHEVENMFYVNEVPWHGLGVKLNNPPTIKQAIVAAGLNWTVSTHSLWYRTDGDILSADSLRSTPNCAVIRDTDHQYLGTVGRSWTPLQNIDAFEFFQPFLDSGLVTLETAGSLRKGKHIWVLARIIGDPITIVGEDTVQRFILLANGHDGTLAATGAFTPIRTVCANTLAFAMEHEDTKMLRVIHSKKIMENLELVQQTIDVANREFVANAELYRELAKRSINKDDLELYIRRVFIGDKKLHAYERRAKKDLASALDKQLAEIGLAPVPTLGKQIIEKVVPLFENGRGNNLNGVSGTWWAAYNSITEYLAYERGRSQDVRLDSLWFGQNALTNRRALNMAKNMAFV